MGLLPCQAAWSVDAYGYYTEQPDLCTISQNIWYCGKIIMKVTHCSSFYCKFDCALGTIQLYREHSGFIHKQTKLPENIKHRLITLQSDRNFMTVHVFALQQHWVWTLLSYIKLRQMDDCNHGIVAWSIFNKGNDNFVLVGEINSL